MTNTVKLKRSATPSAVPTVGDLQAGELAINYNDGNLFYKNTSNQITVIASNQFTSVVGNVTGGNILTGGIVTATGNVIGGNIKTTGLISATANVTGGNILTAGLISAAGNVTANGVTSTGIINLTNTSNVSLGNIANLHISGGSANYILSTDGAGTLSWAQPSASIVTVDDFTGNGVQTEFTLSVTPYDINNTSVNYDGVIQLRTGYTLSGANVVFSTPPANGSHIEVTTISVALAGDAAATGSNTQVQFNNAGNLGASSNFTFNSSTNTLAVSIISTTGNITGNYFIGNGSQLTGLPASYSNTNVATYLASGTNSSNIITTANVSGGNVLTGGLISATGTITGSSHIGSVVSVSANVTGGNLLTGGLISSTGNITGGNVTATTGLTAGTLSLAGNSITSTDSTITIDPATAGSGGNVIIQGNLTVTGNMTYINSNNVTTNDLTINMANNAATAAAANGGGIEVGPAGAPYATITYNSTSNIWVVSNGANVSGALIASGNATGGNLLTGGLISAASTITGSSLLGSVVSASANITGGNLLTGGLISATSTITSAANITGGNVLTSGLISATGNITGGNVLFGAGVVSGTGNIFATNLTGTLQTASQTNITSVGTLGSLTVTANITGGNLLTGGLISATSTITSAANITGGNILTGGLISSTGNIIGNNLGIGTGAAPLTRVDVRGTSNTANATIQIVGTGISTLLLGQDANGGVIRGQGGSNVLSFWTGGTGDTGAAQSGTERGRFDGSGNFSVTANITGGNINTGGLVSATGNIFDGYGKLRAIPQNSQSSAYSLIASDVGKHISITTGGVTANASIFSAGDVVSIYNNSSSNQTITAGTNVTFRLAGSATTGNRTLAQYGVATLLCVTGGANPVFVVSGAGVT